MLQGTLGLVHTEQRSASVLKALEDNGIKATQAAAPLVADYDRANAMDMISPLLGNTELTASCEQRCDGTWCGRGAEG